MSQQQAIAQVAQAALPLAFQEYGNEKAKRQLGIATRTPSLVQTGQQLEQIQRQQNLAPAQALQQYAGLVSPIASGFPCNIWWSENTRANPLTTAAGGAIFGSALGFNPLLGAGVGLLGGLL